MIGIANACYFLGPFSERVIHPADPERYRRNLYRLGFWFSVLLPFSLPALLVAVPISKISKKGREAAHFYVQRLQ